MSIIAAEDQKYIKYYLIFTGTVILLYPALGFLGAGRSTLELVFGQAGLLGVLLIFSLAGIRDPYRHGLQTVGVAAALVLMVSGLALNWLLNWLRQVALNQGLTVAKGTSQVSVPVPSVADMDTVLIVVGVILLAPVLEELFFRFIGVGMVYRLLLTTQVVNKRYLKPVLVCWVVFVSMIFAQLHGPDQISFFLYLLAGLVYSMVYLKYGLLACILVHASGNAGVYLYGLGIGPP